LKNCIAIGNYTYFYIDAVITAGSEIWVFIIVLDGKGVEDHETVYKAFEII
jgi:hypothetical protein